jgi:nucleoside-diphosphate-sugar epimerase
MFFRVYGMDVVIARIFNTYGPGMPRFVALDFLKKLRRRADELEILGDGKQVRDFNYIDDTVAGLIVLAERGEAGRAYNLASGRSGSVTDLAEAILRIRGLAGRTRLVYTGASWTGDAQRWEVDISRIVAAGYRPAVDLEEGLRRTVRWFDEPGSPAEGRG